MKLQDLLREDFCSQVQARLNVAIHVGLLSEHATNLDYLTYKLKTGQDKLELDENGKIKG